MVIRAPSSAVPLRLSNTRPVGETGPTVIYNGYGEQVAGLYQGMDGEKLFM